MQGPRSAKTEVVAETIEALTSCGQQELDPSEDPVEFWIPPHG